MDSMLSLMGLDGVPAGVPTQLALAIAMNGYTEVESRAIMEDGGDGATADEWIDKLKRADYFTGQNTLNDAGSLLWKLLLEKFRKDENAFKHQVMVLDNCIKDTGGRPSCDLDLLANQRAGDSIPFAFVQDNCPWHGCKFAGISVMHFISDTTAKAKRDACRTASRSLGGCKLPPNIEAVRWPYRLSAAFDKAVLAVDDHATALFVHVTDVEIMRHPCTMHRGRLIQRPGTFAHVLVMTISKAGVYLFQAYGPRGYTLMQYMDKHEIDFPLSLSDGKKWVNHFEVFSADPCGLWTEEVNEAYTKCFDIDLENIGCMKVGSQMDVFVQVEEHVLDARTVKANFELLPKPDSSYPKCTDGIRAKAKKPPEGYLPDGGVPHYYIPIISTCGRCGTPPPSRGKHNQCSRCKKICYCSKDCQVADWKIRHKKECQKL